MSQPNSGVYASHPLPAPAPPPNNPSQSVKVQAPSIEQIVSELTVEATRTILLQLSCDDPLGKTRSSLRNHYVAQQLQQQSRVTNFDIYSKQAYHAINTQYPELEGEPRYHKSLEVARILVSYVENIGCQITTHVSVRTKTYAVQALVNIASMILESRAVAATIGHELLQRFQFEDALKWNMKNILATMSREERELAGKASPDGCGRTLLEQIAWINSVATMHALHGLDLSESFTLLGGTKIVHMSYQENRANERQREGCDQEIGRAAKEPKEDEEEEEDDEEEDESEAEEEEEDDDDNEEEGSNMREDSGSFKSFNSCLKEVESIMNQKYSHLGCSEQFEKAFEASCEVEAQIQLIRQNVFRGTDSEDKLEAINALVGIGNAIMSSDPGELASSARNQFRRHFSIPELISSIVDDICPADFADLPDIDFLVEDLRGLVQLASACGTLSFDCLKDTAAFIERSARDDEDEDDIEDKDEDSDLSEEDEDITDLHKVNQSLLMTTALLAVASTAF
ncbi:hypothetical protein Slin15195_G086320 [Septoria linicola]|uniref:Uncharacterized protein n=1 Tax=Septoria linicola TaxID=215465 RepID=A0A9Q9AY21_9PEZI|nr:hypothetical protein Slin14017_G088910 [Septoria linicola]USW55313.1 hypothetical protein Slin15195_G086320 [Septoria linicola]